MKMQLLIAVSESDYAEHLSRVLAERSGDIFEVSVCSAPEHLAPLLDTRCFDAALLDDGMARAADLSRIRLPLLVWDGASVLSDAAQGLPRIQKYTQGRSSLCSKIGSNARCISHRTYCNNSGGTYVFLCKYFGSRTMPFSVPIL